MMTIYRTVEGRISCVAILAILMFECMTFPANAAGTEYRCMSLPLAVEKDIKARVAAIRGAEECEYRKIAKGTLAPSNSDDILVVYDVEDPCYKKKGQIGSCGNFDVQYWAVYRKIHNVYRAIAADVAPGDRIGGIKIENGHIVADVYTYNSNANNNVPPDPICCPSIKTTRVFKVQNGQIKAIGNFK